MSCHNIGHGINSVSKEVDMLLSEQKIDTETARKLFLACRNGVNWCDGNENEAVECIDTKRCGCCLKETSDLTSLADAGYTGRERIRVMVQYQMVTGRLCNDCLREIKSTEKYPAPRDQDLLEEGYIEARRRTMKELLDICKDSGLTPVEILVPRGFSEDEIMQYLCEK